MKNLHLFYTSIFVFDETLKDALVINSEAIYISSIEWYKQHHHLIKSENPWWKIETNITGN